MNNKTGIATLFAATALTLLSLVAPAFGQQRRGPQLEDAGVQVVRRPPAQRPSVTQTPRAERPAVPPTTNCGENTRRFTFDSYAPVDIQDDAQWAFIRRWGERMSLRLAGLSRSNALELIALEALLQQDNRLGQRITNYRADLHQGWLATYHLEVLFRFRRWDVPWSRVCRRTDAYVAPSVAAMNGQGGSSQVIVESILLAYDNESLEPSFGYQGAAQVPTPTEAMEFNVTPRVRTEASSRVNPRGRLFGFLSRNSLVFDY
ncbi:hypothetical protein KBD61_02440 [Patescibacteria group bacterium]|nr:hypothetical protein [Patescibacteria group bacterium]MBP9709867.1 hypothetical protein [Patescibacteria group bacterium]